MPRLIVLTSADGAATDWFVSPPSMPAWEAVLRGSLEENSSLIYANAAAAKSTFVCGPGWRPLGGRIMAITAHYRARQSVAGAGASINIIITQNGTEHIVDTLAFTTNAWTYNQTRVREDWTSSQRFTLADVGDLGVGVEIAAAPSSGRVEVGDLWLEAEYVDVPTVYDPYIGLLPSGVTGPLTWTSSGGEAASIDGDNYLFINDPNPADRRIFRQDNGFPSLRQDYVTEIETRLIVDSTGPDLTRHFYTIARFYDSIKEVFLTALKVNGDYYIGIPGTPFNPNDPDSYLALAPLDYLGKDTHFRLVIDRDPHIDTRGKIEVFVDYRDIPALECWYSMAPAAAPGNTTIEIGSTRLGICDVRTDYISWKHFRKGGDTFRDWKDFEVADNNVKADQNDAEVVPLVNISPPGIIAGQSNLACRLELNVPFEECRVSQLHQLLKPPPTTYGIEVEYRMDGTSGDGQILVQRASDMWFWDNGTSTWLPTFSSTILPYQATRTKYGAISKLESADNELIVTVMNDPLPGPIFTYDILLYKVYLYEE